jgi:hypothetical protein
MNTEFLIIHKTNRHKGEGRGWGEAAARVGVTELTHPIHITNQECGEAKHNNNVPSRDPLPPSNI